MRSLQEAKSIAEAECTESTNKYRKTSRFAIRVLVVVIALGLRSVGVTEVITKHQQQQLVNLVVKGDEKPSPQVCLPYSSTETHQCLITENGVILSSGEPIRQGEFEFCFIRPGNGLYQAEWIGPNAILVKSTRGTFPLLYKMIKRDSLIDGKCPEKL